MTYLIEILTTLKAISTIALIGYVVVFAVYNVVMAMTQEKAKLNKFHCIIFGICLLLTVFIPSANVLGVS